MVAPKYKAIQYDNRQEIIDAFNECHKLRPNKKSVVFLIKLWNEFHDSTAMTLKSFNTCADCRRALKNFFKYVIDEWKTQS